MTASQFPAEGMELTHILVVGDAERARDFYRDVLGAELYRGVRRDVGGAAALRDLAAAGHRGRPDARQAGGDLRPAGRPRSVGHAMTIRVPDCRAAYETLRQRGAVFLTPPVDHEWEVRCFFRDPDGHLLELSEAKALAAGS